MSNTKIAKVIDQLTIMTADTKEFSRLLELYGLPLPPQCFMCSDEVVCMWNLKDASVVEASIEVYDDNTREFEFYKTHHNYGVIESQVFDKLESLVEVLKKEISYEKLKNDQQPLPVVAKTDGTVLCS